MRERWSTDQVHALAPDPSSLGAARGLATPGKWQLVGVADGAPASLWGLCKGSGAKPYQTCVDLDDPAYRCSCPSRKFPCKHSLGLLLMWAAGSVEEGDVPGWVQEWHAGRRERAAKTQERLAEPASAPTPQQEKAAARRMAQRDDRVGRGVADLAQWLDDQVRQGIAGLDKAGYQHFDRVAARLVDAQAPGLAREVKALAGVASSGHGWDHRLLGEFATLRLMTRAYERMGELPEPLADTLRARIGFPMAVERVLAGDGVRDEWQVIGVRDEVEERLTTRRAWLVGRSSGRAALVLSFAVAGQALSSDLIIGTAIDADLYFYPGAVPLRAVMGAAHAPALPCIDPAPGRSVAAVLDSFANAVAADPWTEQLPVLLRGVLVAGKPWHFVDSDGESLPLPSSAAPWHMLAAAGGRPAVLGAEWDATSLRPLALYVDGQVVAA